MEALIHNNIHSIVYGQKTIDFSLLYCDRKTMEIAVHPDSTVIVKAPMQSDLTVIEKKIKKRASFKKKPAFLFIIFFKIFLKEIRTSPFTAVIACTIGSYIKSPPITEHI